MSMNIDEIMRSKAEIREKELADKGLLWAKDFIYENAKEFQGTLRIDEVIRKANIDCNTYFDCRYILRYKDGIETKPSF